MKRFIFVMFALLIVFSLVVIPMSYAAQYQDTPIEQMGDWFATLGKQGVEKDQILVKRKADRIARYAEKMAQQAAKDARKAGAGMKKKMGS